MTGWPFTNSTWRQHRKESQEADLGSGIKYRSASIRIEIRRQEELLQLTKE
jgi:hypothetical protein